MLVELFARFSESYKSIFHFQWWIDLLELNETLWKKKKKKKKKLICVCYCSGSRHQRRHDNRDSSLGSSFRRKHSTRSPSTGEAGGTGASGSERRRERRQRRERKSLKQQSTTTTTAAIHRRSSPIQESIPIAKKHQALKTRKKYILTKGKTFKEKKLPKKSCLSSCTTKTQNLLQTKTASCKIF